MIPQHALDAQHLAEQLRGQGDQPEPLFDVDPTSVVSCALRTALDKLGEEGLRATSLHVAVLADELLAAGCEIAGVRR